MELELKEHSSHSRSEYNTLHSNVNAGVCAPRTDQLAEMFRSFRSGKACSLPTLNLPPYDDDEDTGSAFEGSVYSEIFGGIDFADFALSFDNLFRITHGRSPPPPRTPVEPLHVDASCSASNHSFQNGDVCETPVIGNSCLYDHGGSMLQKEVEEAYCSGVADDIILCKDSSIVFHGSDTKDVFSRPPPTVVEMKKDPASSAAAAGAKEAMESVRPVMNNDMNEADKRTFLVHDLATKSLKFERSNTNKNEDEVAKQEMERSMQASESVYFEKIYEESAMNEEQKIEHYQNSYEGRYFDVESAHSTPSIWQTSNEVPELTCEYDGLKSSNLAATLVEKKYKSTAVAYEDDETLKDHPTEVILVDDDEGEFRSGTFLGILESKVVEMNDISRSTKHLQTTQTDQPMMTEKGREGKLEKLHHKRHVKMREREREKILDKNHVIIIEEKRQREREKELKRERLRKLVKEERERERKKDSIGVELATSAAHGRASAGSQEGVDQAAVETAASEARQRAMAEARERLEKACAEARGKSFSKKSSTEARLRAERVAVLRANAEAREHAIEKAMAQRATFEAQEQEERSDSDKFSSPMIDIKLRHTSSTFDVWSSDKSYEVEGESTQSRSSLETQCSTVEHVTNVLTEKNMRDLDAQKEEAEKNRLAESLDADIKKWSSGKEGNLRALLSTLQYILGPNSGWHPIPLTEVISSAAVKKAYRKATLCVHPDKLQQRGATIQQKYICVKVFDLLKDSWNNFSLEER